MGLEPTNGGTTNHCLNHLATLAINYLSIALFSLFSPENFYFRNGLSLFPVS